MKAFITICLIIGSTLASDQGCTEKTSVIRNGKEYRMFFEHRSAKAAVEACKEWGKEWKSEPFSVDLIKDITKDLQECLKEMIMSYKFGPSGSSEDANTFRYFIGGETENSTKNHNTTGWHWKSGKPIAVGEETGDFQKWANHQPRHKGPYVDHKRCMSAIIESENGSEPGDWVDENCESTLKYICQRDIPEDLIWGYKSNIHATEPEDWGNAKITNHKEWETCNYGNRQSPVDINLRNVTTCKNNLNTVASWGNDTEVFWEVKNTGRMVEIKIQPNRSLYTMFGGSNERYYVDYMHLKWGAEGTSAGSEHSVSGQRHAGELQVFHHSNNGEDKHALAFFIHQRTFTQNMKWEPLLNSIIMSQGVKTHFRMPSPANHIRTLLEDSSKIRKYNTPEYITRLGFRYEGSLTHPPCTENIIWTVYPRPVDLSYSQLSVLRFLHLEGKENKSYRYMRENTRPLIKRGCSYCVVTN